MPTYKQFDIVVVPFPFTDSPKTKRRPALVLSDVSVFKVNKTILTMITSANHPEWALDTKIKDLEAAGLKAPSKIRFKLFTLDNQLIIKKIGSLGIHDRRAITQTIKQLFNI
ncbi:MAG: type II toxin-antitoxin system PemK/MazF family toxin [Cyanobacteria bacterium P01_F01_bin.143]